MALPFDFTVLGPPVSQQARRAERIAEWQQTVAHAAAQLWNGSPPAEGAVTVSVIYFHDGRPFDLDNIPKPILDALKGLVFSDDNQITTLVCRKLNLDALPRVSSTSRALNEAIDNGRQFLHITVENASEGEAISWYQTQLLPKAVLPP